MTKLSRYAFTGFAIALLALAPLAFFAAPAQAQTTIFDDEFEGGNARGWDASVWPDMPNCTCYFSGDCKPADRCNYGPGSFTVEDICNFRVNKPSGNIGTGCDVIWEEPGWAGGICDGICTPRSLGSALGHEDLQALADSTELWSRALLEPAQEGAAVDSELGQAARALLSTEDAGWHLGREVASLLSMAASFQFYDHYCHHEAGDDDPDYFVDLSEDLCGRQAGELVAQALREEILVPGSGAATVERVATVCEDWQTRFAASLEDRCDAGTSVIACLYDEVKGSATFLRTPAGGITELMIEAAPATTAR